MTERWTYGRFRRYRSPPASRWARLVDFAVALTILAVAVFFVLRLHKLDVEKVVGVPILIDGDSLRLGGERIRLKGIDAPEYAQTCTRAGMIYPCGHFARQALASMIAGREVACKGWERDRYGRVIAICRIDETNLNRQMVEEGWAVAYGKYRDSERKARKGKRGIWAGTFEAPRKWRRDHGVPENDTNPEGSAWTWLREFFRLK